MDLYFFRLSLKPSVAPDAFSGTDPLGRVYIRESWLRAFFSETRKFTHWSSPFEFIPVNDKVTNALPEHLIFGWIARPLVVREFTPPDVGFEPTEHPSWRGAFVVIDPTEHADGQKMAVEKRSDVGEPAAILRSLANQMTMGDGPQPYAAQIYPIVQDSSFWRFAEDHDFKVSVLTFDVVVPNMFGGAGQFKDELRTLNEKNNVHRVRTTLVSDGVLDPKANNLDEIVDYTERGAGQLMAKAQDGARYNSQRHAKHDHLDASLDQADFWARVAVWLAGRF